MSYTYKLIAVVVVISPVATKYAIRKLLEWYCAWKTRSSIEIYNRKIGIVSYLYKGNLYKIFIPIRKSPPKIACVLDNDGNDVTEQIRPFLGPGDKFYTSISVTPRMLGYEGLSFCLLNCWFPNALTTFGAMT